MSISRWMDKEVAVHIHNGMWLSYKNEHILVSSHELDEHRAYYTEWSKSERERQIPYIHIYTWNLERWYQWSYMRDSKGDTDIKNRPLDSAGKGVVVVQSLSHVWLFATPSRLPCPSPSPGACSNSCPLSRWCHPTILSSVIPLLFPPSIFPSIRVFSNESLLRIRWPKYWSFSFSISPSDEYSGLISFRIDWFGLLAVQETLSRVFSNTTVQKHQFFDVQPSLWSTVTSTHDYWINHRFDYMDLCRQSDVCAF